LYIDRHLVHEVTSPVSNIAYADEAPKPPRPENSAFVEKHANGRVC